LVAVAVRSLRSANTAVATAVPPPLADKTQPDKKPFWKKPFADTFGGV
jgi:hypothetical protein